MNRDLLCAGRGRCIADGRRPRRQYAVGLTAEHADRLDELIRVSGLSTSGTIEMLLVEAMAHVEVAYEEVVQKVPTLVWHKLVIATEKGAES